MNIHISQDGQRTIKLTRSEITTLKRADCILDDLCRFDTRISEALNDCGASGLEEVLEMPCCQLPPPKPKGTKGDNPSTT